MLHSPSEDHHSDPDLPDKLSDQVARAERKSAVLLLVLTAVLAVCRLLLPLGLWRTIFTWAGLLAAVGAALVGLAEASGRHGEIIALDRRWRACYGRQGEALRAAQLDYANLSVAYSLLQLRAGPEAVEAVRKALLQRHQSALGSPDWRSVRRVLGLTVSPEAE